MKNLIARLPAFDPDKKCVNVVIETPKGSCIKYAYDAECGLFALKRALPQGFAFPFNFGFVPSTLGEDGDPLDILILNEEPLFPGCLVKPG
jgi:inorganic pyrophosphatase